MSELKFQIGWYFVKKKGMHCPECAVYGYNRNKKLGFHLLWEDDKVYQAEDFDLPPRPAIDPVLLKCYTKIKNNQKLSECEFLHVRLYTCKHCIVEGCPSPMLCFSRKIEKILMDVGLIEKKEIPVKAKKMKAKNEEVKKKKQKR